jgi:hypothetical protein
MDANFAKYSAANAPAILMPGLNHTATFGVFNRWRAEIARRQGVSALNVDYSNVSPGEAWQLAEEQLEAAGVPLDLRDAYFDAFNEYLQLLQ